LLGRTRIGAQIRINSAALIWWQNPTHRGGTNLYLVASSSMATAKVQIW
jgi:hypothetical protein